MTTMTTPADVKLSNLRNILKEMESVLIAYSGGLDSSFLVAFAKTIENLKATAFIADSPALPRREYERAVEFVREIGVGFVVEKSDELSREEYVRNDPDRCYFCKARMCARMRQRGGELGAKYICDGEIADDMDDYRPGRRAADEAGLRHPLAQAGITKNDVRNYLKEMGFSFWDMPKTTCLASRFPYGSKITASGLRAVEEAEAVLANEGFAECRVRHHGDAARLEIPPEMFSRMLDDKIRQRIIDGVKRCGFCYVSMDLQGFRSGSMNEILDVDEKKNPS